MLLISFSNWIRRLSDVIRNSLRVHSFRFSNAIRRLSSVIRRIPCTCPHWSNTSYSRFSPLAWNR